MQEKEEFEYLNANGVNNVESRGRVPGMYRKYSTVCAGVLSGESEQLNQNTCGEHALKMYKTVEVVKKEST